ncbi:MAG: Aminopeptidase, partial [Myxococcaceae bacterium]|nr:Aminopeptidase [Myxococcaceae bacterium]
PVRFGRGACVGATCAVTAESPSIIVVRPSTPVAPGGRLRVAIDLTATLPAIAPGRTNLMAQGMESMSALSSGESGGDYGLLAVGDGVVSLANFYPVLARRVGGRWERTDGGAVGDLGSDELSNVHATLDFPAGYTVATTGVALRRAEANGRLRVEVGASVVRDFAVMAGAQLEVATRRVGEVEVRSIFRPAHREAGQRVLDVASHAVEVFERRFGAYPYVDLDVVEAPLVGGAGGVEFPGLVTVASMFYGDGPTQGPPTRVGATGAGGGLGDLAGLLSSLGGNGGAAATALGQMLPAMLEFVTAHEVAHQWWHAMVGSDSRAHPFIDESLAQWSAALYLEDRYGIERARRDGDMQIKMNYQFMRTLGQADAAVDRPASAFATPIAYAGLVYGKGPYLYNALRTAAGDAVFGRAVQRYVSTWRFRIAPATGFVDALVAEDGAHAARYRALAHRWLYESHGDDDLGQMDLGALVGNMLGGPNGQVSPEVQDALRMLGPLLQGMGRPGGGGATPATPGAPATPGGDVSPAQLQELLNGVMQQLDAQ